MRFYIFAYTREKTEFLARRYDVTGLAELQKSFNARYAKIFMRCNKVQRVFFSSSFFSHRRREK